METQAVQEALRRHLEFVKDEIVRRMDLNRRNASMRSVRSLDIIIEGNKGILEGSMSYVAMEKGRKGGKVPKGFHGIIKQWIIDKGIAVTPIPAKTSRAKLSPQERGLNSMAGAIANKIAREGTRLHRENGFDDIYSTAIDIEMDEMENELLDKAAKTCLIINQESFK